uniref:Leucine-rich repeat-containing protein 15 n=1 Tax=Steinernema glaseri TaxID=37863 RepID=A0A1I7XYS5_9BILA
MTFSSPGSRAFKLLLLFMLPTLVFAQCPALQGPCRCAPSIYEPVAIICEQAGSLQNALNSIQAAKGLPIDSLTIIDTAVSSIPAGAFQGFTIARLVLNRNTLSSINEHAFDGTLIDSLVELDLTDNNLGQVAQAFGIYRLRNLRKLYLNRNRLTSLSASDFANFASSDILLKLELAGNRLTDTSLNEQSFRSLRSLQELSLETNNLRQIPSAALAWQRETLTNLNLGLNQINEVPAGALYFPSLTSLSLEFNGIQNIQKEALQGVPSLQYLYVTGNRFPAWNVDMFSYINELRTLGIGETPINTIPENAFMHTPKLIRLEMSEAAVDTIEQGAFQKTPRIQAIIMNKNRLSLLRADMFAGLEDLYSIDVSANRIAMAEPLTFANLRRIRHLDISNNQLQTLPVDCFENSFQPEPNDRRVIYACNNPWLCDSSLDWFRDLLRSNADIDIDKPNCVAVCMSSPNNCPLPGTPLREENLCQFDNPNPQPQLGRALHYVGWIILAIILTILMISICLLALVRYGMSHRHKKQKDQEIEDENRIMSGAYQASMISRSYAPSHAGIDLDLPKAHSLEDRPTYLI